MFGQQSQPVGVPVLYHFPGLEQWQDHNLYMLTTRNAVMTRVYKKLGRILSSHASVLLRAERGAGKAVLAQALHHAGAKKPRVLHEVQCATATEQHLAAALGPMPHEVEKIASINGTYAHAPAAPVSPTLLLKNVAAASPALQLGLMQWLRGEHEYAGVSNFRIRLLATTTEDLAPLVERGLFRQDLFYRLSTYELILPPLRERQEDLVDFVDHVSARAARRHGGVKLAYSARALAQLAAHAWPDNLRELNDVVARAYATNRGNSHVIDHFDLTPSGPQTNTPLRQNDLVNKALTLERSLEVSTA